MATTGKAAFDPSKYNVYKAFVRLRDDGKFWTDIPAIKAYAEGDTLRELSENMFKDAAVRIKDYPEIDDYAISFEDAITRPIVGVE